jgi:hypothetical protein
MKCKICGVWDAQKGGICDICAMYNFPLYRGKESCGKKGSEIIYITRQEAIDRVELAMDRAYYKFKHAPKGSWQAQGELDLYKQLCETRAQLMAGRSCTRSIAQLFHAGVRVREGCL